MRTSKYIYSRHVGKSYATHLYPSKQDSLTTLEHAASQKLQQELHNYYVYSQVCYILLYTVSLLNTQLLHVLSGMLYFTLHSITTKYTITTCTLSTLIFQLHIYLTLSLPAHLRDQSQPHDRSNSHPRTTQFSKPNR
jgi:hypothetical protein